MKNNIAAVGSLLSMQIQSVSNNEARSILQAALARVNSMRVLYDKLLIQNDYKEGSVKSYIEDLIDSLRNLLFEETDISIDTQIADFALPSRTLFSLGIIINELLTNTIRHAFAGNANGRIEVTLTKRDNEVALTIQDNGSGLPEDFAPEKATGFGLTLVKMLSEQLGGTYAIEHREDAGGTRSIVEFDV